MPNVLIPHSGCIVIEETYFQKPDRAKFNLLTLIVVQSKTDFVVKLNEQLAKQKCNTEHFGTNHNILEQKE